MSKRIVIALLGVVLIVATSASPGVSQKLPERLVWGTMKAPSASYQLSLGVTDFINQNTNINVTVRPYPTPSAAIRGLHVKEADLSIMAYVHANHFARGIDSEVEKASDVAAPEIRILMGSDVVWVAWVTRANSGIKTMADLKGKTVNYALPGLILKNFLGGESLRAVDIDPQKDIKAVLFDRPGGEIQALIDKKLDAIFVTIDQPALIEAETTVGVKILSYPMNAFQKLPPVLKDVSVIAKDVPIGYRRIVKEPLTIMGFGDTIGCRNDLNEDGAYLIVKLLMTRGHELKKIAPMFMEIGEKEFALPGNFSRLVPIHPGAIKYFKEIGFWTPAHEKMQKEAVEELSKIAPR